MSARRRSTVHDFSTLRLHPDGSRVAINSPPRDGPSGSRTRKTGRDARGNRIARDAAGLGVVPKRTVIRKDDGDDDGDGDGDEDDEVRNIEPRKPLRRKRRRIDDDVEFLGDSGNVARRTGETAIADGEAMSWPVPSSDLLKCVHFFASQYYTAQGLLSDQQRIYKLRQRKAGAGVVQATDSDAEMGEDVDADDLFAEDVEDSESVFGGEDRYKGGIVKDRERGEGKCSPPESVPNMHRALDGSALMAIGMLLQEHVSTLLRPNIPPGWEEEMHAAGLIPRDENSVLDAEISEDAESDKSDDEVISCEYASDDKD